MSRIDKWYPGFKRGFFPVLHYKSAKDTVRNILLAEDVGAAGVFFINQGINDRIFEDFVNNCCKLGFINRNFIGVNFLNKEPYETIRSIPCVNALWADHAHSESYYKMREINDKFSDFNFTGPYFGGVAFKYTRQVDLTGDKLVSAIEEAKPYVNIITTSGEATGSAPDVNKIKLFRDILGEDHALAIASGITVDNVDLFLPYADCFLVASGIEKEFGVLDPVKTKALADKIFDYKSWG